MQIRPLTPYLSLWDYKSRLTNSSRVRKSKEDESEVRNLSADGKRGVKLLIKMLSVLLGKSASNNRLRTFVHNNNISSG